MPIKRTFANIRKILINNNTQAITAAVILPFLFLSLAANIFIFDKHSAEKAEAHPSVSMHNTRGADVMKYTKDTMANQPTDKEIENIVSILKGLNITHIALSIPMDADNDYPQGSRPSPRSSVALTQKWADTVHGQGLKVIWRGTWSGIEGIYNFPKRVGQNRFPAGTAASAETDGHSTWLGKTYQYIINNPSFFQAGDIWAPLPERTEGIFSDSTSFLPSGGELQSNYVNFFNDLKTVSDKAFLRVNKNVITGMTANNYSEVMSGWLPQSLFDHNKIVSIDYYGIDHSSEEMENDIRRMAKLKGKPVFLQEWGDYWNVNLNQAQRTQYLSGIYAVLKRLADDGVLAGFNYWGGWDNSAEGILSKTATGYELNYRGQMLKDFYAGFSNSPNQNVLNPDPIQHPPQDPPQNEPPDSNGGLIDIPAEKTANTCPGPAYNAYAACFYKGTQFNQFIFSRTDPSINFDWGQKSPDPLVPEDFFSARWEGKFPFEQGTHTFTVRADDGVRLYVDNQLLIDQWKDQPASTYSAIKNMSKGDHLVRMEYYEAGGGAVANLSFKKEGQNIPPGSFIGSYFSDMALSRLAFSRIDQSINFNWGKTSL
jgi:hypothetical protein